MTVKESAERCKAALLKLKHACERLLNFVRFDRHGSVDDAAIECDCVRIERTDRGVLWIAVYRGDKRICFRVLSSESLRIVVTENELVDVDDTKASE